LLVFRPPFDRFKARGKYDDVTKVIPGTQDRPKGPKTKPAKAPEKREKKEKKETKEKPLAKGPEVVMQKCISGDMSRFCSATKGGRCKVKDGKCERCGKAPKANDAAPTDQGEEMPAAEVEAPAATAE
jgi:hypothetical protein